MKPLILFKNSYNVHYVAMRHLLNHENNFRTTTITKAKCNNPFVGPSNLGRAREHPPASPHNFESKIKAVLFISGVPLMVYMSSFGRFKVFYSEYIILPLTSL